MLGTRFIDEERQIGLQVPQVADRTALTAAAQQKTVQVYRDGTIMLDRQPVSLAQTYGAAGRRARRGPATWACCCAATPPWICSRPPPC